jgi:alpha-mannosidase
MQAGLDRFDPTGRRFEMALDRVDLSESGEVRATLLLEGRLLNAPVEMRFYLYDGLDRVDLEVELDWKEEKPVRVQVVFPTGLADAEFHYGVPYGFSAPGPMREEGWGDQCLGWIAVDGAEAGMVIASDRSGFEFEAGMVRSNLLHSWIDPVSFSYRRVWRTYPERVQARYTIRGYDGDFRSGMACRDGWHLHWPLRSRPAYDVDAHRPLPHRLSLISLEGEGVVITAFKRAEDGDGFILRAFETLGRACRARVKSCWEILKLSQVDLLERPAGKIDPEQIAFAPFEIKTLRLNLGEGA